jgi:hypothetical protein
MLIDFEPEDLEMMCIGDQVLIRAWGRGLKLVDCPNIVLRNCSPELIEAWPLEITIEGKLVVPVVLEIPSEIMGSGTELLPDYVDADINTGDRALVESIGLTRLRIGDLVAIRDQDHSYGRGYQQGAVVIGVIIHGDSVVTGHGPGVLDLLTCPGPFIEPVIVQDANIGNYLRFGMWSNREEAKC